MSSVRRHPIHRRHRRAMPRGGTRRMRQKSNVRRTVRPRSHAFREHLQSFTEAHPELNPDRYTPRRRFTYDNLTKRPYNNRTHNIRSVTFPIKRNGGPTRIIRFPTPVTQKAAVKAAESFLSGPLTRELFAVICTTDNDVCSDKTFESVVADRLSIGDLLDEDTFLTGFHTTDQGDTHLIVTR